MAIKIRDLTYVADPMLTRPDTPANLAVEDRGMATVLGNCSMPMFASTSIRARLYPPVVIGPVVYSTALN